MKKNHYENVQQASALILPFAVLRAANVLRLPRFKNKQGERAHAKSDGSDWSIFQWFQAIFGELGEYANLRKKFDRGDFTDEAEYKLQAGKELADILIYIDIAAFRLGIDLGGWIAHTLSGMADTPAPIPAGEHEAYDYSAFTFSELAQWSFAEDLHAKPEAERLCTVGRELSTAAVCAMQEGNPARYCLARAVIELSHLAAMQGINLSRFVEAKYNEVSERVDCGIFICTATNGRYYVEDEQAAA